MLPVCCDIFVSSLHLLGFETLIKKSKYRGVQHSSLWKVARPWRYWLDFIIRVELGVLAVVVAAYGWLSAVVVFVFVLLPLVKLQCCK